MKQKTLDPIGTNFLIIHIKNVKTYLKHLSSISNKLTLRDLNLLLMINLSLKNLTTFKL